MTLRKSYCPFGLIFVMLLQYYILGVMGPFPTSGRFIRPLGPQGPSASQGLQSYEVSILLQYKVGGRGVVGYRASTSPSDLAGIQSYKVTILMVQGHILWGGRRRNCTPPPPLTFFSSLKLQGVYKESILMKGGG